MRNFLSPVDSRSGTFESSGGKIRYGHLWSPEGEEPWAVLCVIHGFGDHGGRFAGMATSLASTGISVLALDLVGHGRSAGRRGCIESYEHLLDEVDLSLDCAERYAPSKTRFLMGQSMGGNVVLNWALGRGQSQSLVQGVVCGSAMLRSPKLPKEQIMNAGRWLARKFPNARIPAYVQVERLSQDRRAQDAYLRDPWVHRCMSLRLALGLIDQGEWAIAHASQLTIPTMLMHGSDDTLTCLSGARAFVERSNGQAQLRVWPECRHDLHDEPQRERVFAYMHRWIKDLSVAPNLVVGPRQETVKAA